MFERNSRYFDLGKAYHITSDGNKFVYIRRRFIPKRNRDVTYPINQYFEGDRLDLLAGRILGDPEAFWRICDVNTEMNPRKLFSEPEIWINIPLNACTSRCIS